jgi:hypothetical protein
MPYELCRHVKTNGKRCESPALTGEFWCFFHNRLLTRHRNLHAIKSETPTVNIQIPALEDRESIQVALSLIVDAIATGVLAEKRAAILLRAIGIASRNALDIDTEPCHTHRIVRNYMANLDGNAIAPRQMDDNSQPPPRPPRPGRLLALDKD